MINLHAIVRGAITAVNPDEEFLIIQSLGEQNVKGKITAKYADAVLIKAQMQSLNGDELQQFDNTLRTEIANKFYLYSQPLRPCGQFRVISRTGDFLFRIKDGTIWRIFNVAEDFDAVGWVLVNASMQVEKPALVMEKINEYYAEK